MGIKGCDAGLEAIEKVAKNFTPKSLRAENVCTHYQKMGNNIIPTLLCWFVGIYATFLIDLKSASNLAFLLPILNIVKHMFLVVWHFFANLEEIVQNRPT